MEMKLNEPIEKLEQMIRDIRISGVPAKTTLELSADFAALFAATGDERAEVLEQVFLIRHQVMEGNYQRGLELANALIGKALRVGEYWSIVNLYNMMGIAHNLCLNAMTAIDCFWKALLEVERSNPTDAACICMAYANIACCLLNAGSFELSIDYFNKAECAYTDQGLEPSTRQRMTILVNYVTCYANLGEYDRAWEYLREWELISTLCEVEGYLDFELAAWKYMLSMQSGKGGDTQAMEDNVFALALNKDSLEELFTVGQFSLERKEYRVVQRVLQRIEELCPEFEGPRQELIYLSQRARYCEENGDIEGFGRACMRAFRVQQRSDSIDRNARAEGLRTYIELGEMQRHNLEMEQARQIMQRKSEVDELTGLANRYKLKEFCTDAFAGCAASGEAICISILDIDFFKALNDSMGHLQGDQCLQAIAAEVEKSLGVHDLGARYGGDELVIVRVGYTDAQVRDCMEQLRLAVIGLDITNKRSPFGGMVTISQGAVNRHPTAEDNFSALLRIADKALYQAKRQSKNTFILA
ncbi:MAG: GGDEF domain-containing protein [Angelakisella sp.]